MAHVESMESDYGVAATDELDDIERYCNRIVDLQKELEDSRTDYRLLEAALGMHTDDKIFMQGFLKKKTPGRVLGREFDRRWFVLKGSHLRYYEEKGAIAVDEKTEIGFAEKDPVAFTVHHPKMHRKFELRCESAEERDRWMAVISGTPMPSDTNVMIDLEETESAEEKQRAYIDAHEDNRRQFFYHWMMSEMTVCELRMKDLRKARDFAIQLLNTDEKMQKAAKEAADTQAELEGIIEVLEGKLAKEISRKERTKAEGSAALEVATNKNLTGNYFLTWSRWLAMRREEKKDFQISTIEKEKFILSGRLSEAQEHGERFMLANHASQRKIMDLEDDLARMESETTWLAQSNKQLFDEMKGIKDLVIGDLRAEVKRLEDHRDRLQHNLDVTTADLLATRERLRLKTNEADEKGIMIEELTCRFDIATEFHMNAFELQAQSVLSATRQTYGGRVLSSMDGWDDSGGKIWRDVYLWTDAEKGRLCYAHRDRKWGECESMELSNVVSVEVESFFEYTPPIGLDKFRHLGFYIEMKDGSKHRFCARTSVERAEWLDNLRGLVLAVCYISPPRQKGSSEMGSPIPPRPAVPGGSPWAALPGGGGSPRAAMANSIKATSQRRTRAEVIEPTYSPTYGHPNDDTIDHLLRRSQSPREKTTMIPPNLIPPAGSPRRSYFDTQG